MARMVMVVVMVLLSGCSSLGMMYAHRDTMGLDLATGVDATAPFHITLGTANHMATYVPVAVPDGNLPVGSSTAVLSAAISKALQSADAKQLLQSIATNSAPIADMFSVYSTFSTKPRAGVGTLTVDRGNTFATGLAAQSLANADKARTCLALEQLFEINKADTTRAPDIRATIKATCMTP